MTTSALITYAFLFVSLYFEVFMLVAFLERRSLLSKATKEHGYVPRVCVVVPCFNEQKTLAATLHSLLALRYPADKLEIIVVDDGSQDNTHAIALAFAGDPRVKVVSKENGGKHSAMNVALQRTSAELIGCLDADSVVDPHALAEIVPLFGKEQIAAVTPGIHARKPITWIQHMQEVEYHLSIFNRFMLAGLGSVFITPGPFSIFRASVVKELGGWKYAHSTEDMEMALRIQNAGHLIANAPRALVYTATPASFRPLFKQRVRWTYGWLRNAFDYRHMLGNRAYGNLGLIILPMALISIATGIYFFLRLVSYAIAVAFQEVTRIQIVGLHPHLGYDPFYANTSVLWFLVWTSVALILALICIGSLIGTGKRRPPVGTPLFIIFYSFFVPLWLIAAVVRAVFKTGVQWR